MPRLPRVVVLGFPHHIVQRGNNKQHVFLDEQDRIVYLNFLRTSSNRSKCNILTYCLMPNHIHLLLQPTAELGLSKMMHGLGFRYSQYFNKKYDRVGRLWGSRYYSSAICSQDYLYEVVRYIEQNPVRAGLVEQAIEYPWSSAGSRVFGESKDILNDPDHLVESAVKQGVSPVLSDEKLQEIRKRTLSGIPLGLPGLTDGMNRQLLRQLFTLASEKNFLTKP